MKTLIDEMQHTTAFNQGLHFLLIKQQSGTQDRDYNLETSTCDPLKVQNGQSHNYCINMCGKIHRNTKGYCDKCVFPDSVFF